MASSSAKTVVSCWRMPQRFACAAWTRPNRFWEPARRTSSCRRPARRFGRSWIGCAPAARGNASTPASPAAAGSRSRLRSPRPHSTTTVFNWCSGTSPPGVARKTACARARNASRSPSPAHARVSGTGTSRPATSSTRRAGSRCSATKTTRSSRTSAPGNDWCTPPIDASRIDAQNSVARGEPTFEAEFRLRHKDGHFVHVLSRGYPVRREAGGPVVRIVGTHLDLTEHKQAEAALRESEERLTAGVRRRAGGGLGLESGDRRGRVLAAMERDAGV